MNALLAELKKQKHSSIVWVTFAAFALAPIMGGLFMLIAQHPDRIAQNGMLRQKAEMMSFAADWNSYLGILSQAVGVGGILIFGFVASWIFGREYADGTAKDLLALPVRRVEILNAKFILYLFWCIALTLTNLLLVFIIGYTLQLDGWMNTSIITHLKLYSITTVLTMAVCAPVSVFALIGRGYMAPLGFTALTLVLAQIIAAAGVGFYFPWSIPGLFSGAGGEYKDRLDIVSYLIVLITGLCGYSAALLWWTKADQQH